MNLDDFLTVEQVCKKLGCGRRSLYRAMHRAAEAGEKNFTVEILGRRLFPKEAIAVVEKYYYPYYSEQHQAMVQEWGRMGGETKAANQKKKTRAAKR